MRKRKLIMNVFTSISPFIIQTGSRSGWVGEKGQEGVDSGFSKGILGKGIKFEM
jgi:hypothetical protein